MKPWSFSLGWWLLTVACSYSAQGVGPETAGVTLGLYRVHPGCNGTHWRLLAGDDLESPLSTDLWWLWLNSVRCAPKLVESLCCSYWSLYCLNFIFAPVYILNQFIILFYLITHHTFGVLGFYIIAFRTCLQVVFWRAVINLVHISANLI